MTIPSLWKQRNCATSADSGEERRVKLLTMELFPVLALVILVLSDSLVPVREGSAQLAEE